MKIRQLGVAAMALALAAPGAAQDDRLAGGLGHWKDVAAGYRIAREADADRPLKLREDPVLRWNNPLRKALDGGAFVWTDRGRPEVVACFYSYGDEADPSEDHEFMSVSLGPLEATRDGKTAWSPAEAGVAAKPIPDAPAPAASAAGRLRQMGTLAREFKANFNNPQDKTEIRLLPKPLYRYEIESGRTDVTDGALFAFVNTTDPEVLLLIEARSEAGAAPRWHYAIARMSMVNLRVSHKDREVWLAPWDSDLVNPTKPYMARTVVGSGRR